LTDPRAKEYARVIVEHSLDVQPGWQVLIRTTPFSRPLLEEVMRLIARRGAHVIQRMGFTLYPIDYVWAREAPEELVAELPSIERYACDHMDARITIDAPENVREGSDIKGSRREALRRGAKPFYRRTMADEIPWVGCQYPTPALAQEAGMTLRQFSEFLYGACLLDWNAERERMRRLADRFDAAREVRIVGTGTDLTLSLEGRSADVDAGEANLPGGEFYFGPVEDSAEGVVTFSEFALEYSDQLVAGARLRFERGLVVDASADSGEQFLLETLDTDEGARRIGEFGVGCNEKVDRYTQNVGFDEKIAGTIHLALGASYPETGGTNESLIHWDMVKDLRSGGRIECDGEVVQENGNWLI
jgi:aminopeptidase